MKRYEFNRNEFEWAEEFYEVIKQKMEFPEFFGKNADALWDMLTGFVELPIEVVFVGFNKEENADNKAVLSKILKCFTDAQEHFPSDFSVKFE